MKKICIHVATTVYSSVEAEVPDDFETEDYDYDDVMNIINNADDNNTNANISISTDIAEIEVI